MLGKRLKGVSIVILFIFVLSIGMTSCGSSANKQGSVQKVNLRFAYNWTGSDGKASAFEGELHKYMNQNKDKVNISLEATPGMDYAQKMQVDMAADNTPDVFTWWPGGQYMQDPATKGVLLDMDQYFNASTKTKKDQFGGFDLYTFNGKIYGIPIENYWSSFIVNTDLFAKAGIKNYPKTWQDIIDDGPAFKKIGIIPLMWASKGTDPAAYIVLSEFLYQYSGEYEKLQSMNTTYQFKDADTLKVAQLILDARKNNLIPQDTIATGGDDAACAVYAQQKAAMMSICTYHIPALNADTLAHSVIIPFPKLPDADIDPSTFVVGSSSMGYSINSKSFKDAAKKSAIVNFMDFLTSDEMYSALVQTSMFPGKNVKINTTNLAPFFIKQMDIVDKLPASGLKMHLSKFMPGSAVATVYSDSTDQLFAGNITAKQYVDNIQSALDKAKSGQ